MEGFGGRLRARAQALGLSDAEVARRAGLSEQRYGHYVRDVHAPDLDTLVRIARVLGATTDSLLTGDSGSETDAARAALEARLLSASRSLDLNDLKVLIGQAEIFAQLRRSDDPRAP
ncbi:transcriptional regulator [Azospirillum palustre]|uniref:Transcriptional regulator n=1 Tax=Azospirillum palustre TaxID=2044885 RepID=A0A2B8B8P0_9PROT|nr:helix-turn-helix transcriptional regulator [Azospirillum palustre]PGH57664.1 transcriptional regulator [Azospirillum palustre]